MTDPPEPGPWVDGLTEGRRGTVVHDKGNRRVYRVEDDGRVWFAKVGAAGKRTGVETEARVHAALAGAGLPVAPLLAAGPHGDAHWLVTAAAPGVPLRTALRDADVAEARALVDDVASAIRRLHGAGYRWADLTSDHVFVDGAVVTLIDVARAEAGSATVRRQARDLAGLLCSLPFGGAGRVLRTRLVAAASGLRGDALRALFREIDRAARKLTLRTRWRHAHVEASAEVRAVVATQCGTGADLFDSLCEGDFTTRVRTLRDRENRRFEGPDGRAFFMKWYPPVKQGLSPAMRERAALGLLARKGIPVCREAAYGEDLARGSFVVVRGCDGEPLDDLLRRGVTVDERRELVAETARIWRRLRNAGLRHRDAYACHVFAARRDAGFELRLIDLSRAGPAPFPRERWFVKDAAQLWHGVPRPPVTRTDAVRWLRVYFGVDRLTAEAKKFARRVASKEGRISARQRRKGRA